MLLLAAAPVLYRAAIFAWGSSLYSHILLIPVVSAYFAWTNRPGSARIGPPRATALAIAAWGGAVAALGLYVLASRGGWAKTEEDFLCAGLAAVVLAFVGNSAWFLGARAMRTIAFPYAFLVFAIPLPTVVTETIEHLLQHSSAYVADLLLRSVGTPVYRQGLVLELSNIKIEVAPQCSGIHSSLALLITSIVAGHVFLQSRWRRAALALAVLPLAVLRNGFRVSVLGELCVRYGAHMIDSFIHHRGGPIFFALSLIPFTLYLFVLKRGDKSYAHASPKHS